MRQFQSSCVGRVICGKGNAMRRFLRAILVAGLAGAFVALLAPPPTAIAFPGPDAQCPYGWDTNTNTCLPNPGAGNGGGSNDAACQATARFDYCQRSVFIGCDTQGNQFACRLLQLSYSDPNTFQQIMNAQKACTLDGDGRACAYLKQYKGVYY